MDRSENFVASPVSDRGHYGLRKIIAAFDAPREQARPVV
jgi:hypothetical protein